MTATDLVGCFFSEAPVAFAFLGDGGSYPLRTSLRHHTSRGMVDVTPERVTGLFIAVWRAETPELVVDLSFGDREYALSLHPAPPTQTPEFDLWEWSEVFPGEPTIGSRDGQFCGTPDRLRRELARYAAVLGRLVERVTAWDETDLVQLRHARANRLQAWIAADREDQHARARAEADAAFRVGNFRRVTELLAPFDDVLTAAERTKLILAARK